MATTRRARSLLATVALVALVLAGCSSSDDGGDDATGDTTTTTADAGDTGGDGGGTTTTAGGDATATTVGGAGAEGLNDLAGQLNDADLGCDTVEGQRDAAGATGAAQCDLSTENPAYLYSFDDNAQRDDFIDNGGVIDCTFIFGSGVTFDYVVADGVIIRPEDNADAQALADALGGEVRTISCELPDAAGGG
ncbi:MAG: hypothetical protein KDB35_09255 [Acidimicrobiales bacterium]|nr:hypothetical protein [Acidimicrobiales bacterium]MCB1016426.1 hypothetical protein [Acidimicrobiales bacterium]MCB9372474.1 hypothetical protein [Microthrixaceae bacterium]